VRDVRLLMQPTRQPLQLPCSHSLESCSFCVNARGVVVGVLSQVDGLREEVAVQRVLQALRIRQRVDIDSFGVRHAVKVGGSKRSRWLFEGSGRGRIRKQMGSSALGSRRRLRFWGGSSAADVDGGEHEATFVAADCTSASSASHTYRVHGGREVLF
jgi:hypothetical protein